MNPRLKKKNVNAARACGRAIETKNHWIREIMAAETMLNVYVRR